MSENYGISFAEYKREFTQDAGGAMLDRQAVADIPGVKVRRSSDLKRLARGMGPQCGLRDASR